MSELERSEFELEEDELDRKGTADALIVFGFGIKDPIWMQKEKEAVSAGAEILPTDESEGWMLSLGAKMRVQAAAELYLKGATRDVIFTGGATRTKDGIDKTEAEVMQEYFLHILKKRKFEELKGEQVELSESDKRDIEQAAEQYTEEAKSHLIKEDQATNTIENFSRTLAMFDRNPDKYKKIALLSNRFHIDRIGQLSEQFMMKADQEYGAEDVMAEARAGKRHEAMTTGILNRYLDSEEYYDFTLRENQWRGGLRKVPEYFLPQTIYVDLERFRQILQNMASQEEVYDSKLAEMGINTETLDSLTSEELGEVRQKVANIDRFLPTSDWAAKEPEAVFATPPARFEKRSEYTDPLERARHLETLVFSDVDGTLHLPGGNHRLVGEYARLLERCSGEIILTSSRSRGDLERLRQEYKMSELAPIIFENGGGIVFDSRVISQEDLEQIAQEQGLEQAKFVRDGNSLIVELSPHKEALRENFDQIAKEMGLDFHYVTDLPADKIAALYNITVQHAQQIKDGAPSERKYFMENIVFDEPPTEEQQVDLIAKAREQGLHLTRARITWHLMSAEVHKGKAVRFVQAVYKKVSENYQNSIAIGDAPNDYEMFKECDQAYYVGDDELEVESSQPTGKKGPDGAIEVIRGRFLNMEAE